MVTNSKLDQQEDAGAEMEFELAALKDGKEDAEVEVEGTRTMEEDRPEVPEGPRAGRRQLVAALCAHVGALIMATIWSWSSTALPSLREEAAGFGVISADHEAWIASITFLAGAVGGPMLGPVADRVGLRMSILLVTIPMLAGWLLVAFAQNVATILVGRFITGFFVCGVVVSNNLIAELSHKNRRGRLNFIFDMQFCVGVLLIYVVGTFTGWRVQAGFCAGICGVYVLLLMVVVPESVSALLRQGKIEEATKVLRFIRDRVDVEQELNEASAAVEEELQRSKMDEASIRLTSRNPVTRLWARIASLCTRPVLKPIALSICLQFFLQVCGVVPIVCYAVDVFRAAGAEQIHENVSTIVFGAINLVATIVAYFFVDKSGRRKLFIGSELGLAASLLVIGTFLYAKNGLGHATALEPYSWVLLVFFGTFVIAYSFGVGPLPWVIIGEILEPSVRGASSGVISFATRVFGFLVMFYFKAAVELVGQHGVYWGFGAVCLAGAIFAYSLLPETKGRKLDEVQEDLRRGWCVAGGCACV